MLLVALSLLYSVLAQTTCTFTGTLTGALTLTQEQATLKITGTIESGTTTMADGDHGFHIHTYGDLSNSCAGAGSHYNPTQKMHGAPTTDARHAGDLGNIVVTGGKAVVAVSDTVATLDGVLGRAIVVHQFKDDLGLGGNSTSLTTGNAGARLGCCIISAPGSTAITAAPTTAATDATTTTAATTAAPTTTTTTAATTAAPTTTTTGGATTTTTAATPNGAMATCTFVGTVAGELVLTQVNDKISIKGTVTGLTEGEHGMHVHTFGSTANNCSAAGSHYNPTNATHGAPNAATRHVGDLGNIVASTTSATIDVSDMIATLGAIAGRSIVLHAARDDLGTGGNATSLTTGNSGGRVGCCVITMMGVAPITAPPTTTATTVTIDPQTLKPCDQQQTCLSCLSAVQGCHFCTKVQISSRSPVSGRCLPAGVNGQNRQACDVTNNAEIYDTTEADKCVYEQQLKCLALSCKECVASKSCSFCKRPKSISNSLSFVPDADSGLCMYDDTCDEISAEECSDFSSANALAYRVALFAPLLAALAL